MARKHSEETKKKMSDANKGRVFTEAHKAKLSANANKTRTPESNAKRAETMRLQWAKKKGEQNEY